MRPFRSASYLLACVVIALLLTHTPASAAPFYGIARAQDGDSLTVGDREVHLFGIDATLQAR